MAAKRKPIQFAEVARVLEKSACVLCTLVKPFQTTRIQDVQITETPSLCAFHTWAIAGAAATQSAAQIFLRLLDTRGIEEETQKNSGCSLCADIAQEELRRARDFATLLSDPEFRNWLDAYGALCLPHAKRLLQRVSPQNRAIVISLVDQTATRLKAALRPLADGARARLGAVVLSHVAEYLESRRGLGFGDVADSTKRFK